MEQVESGTTTPVSSPGQGWHSIFRVKPGFQQRGLCTFFVNQRITLNSVPSQIGRKRTAEDDKHSGIDNTQCQQ